MWVLLVCSGLLFAYALVVSVFFATMLFFNIPIAWTEPTDLILKGELITSITTSLIGAGGFGYAIAKLTKK